MNRTCYLPAFLLVAALLMLKSAVAQDRVYVFFESGSAKLDDAQLKVLDRIRVKYNLSEIDSIRITGFADSLGNQKANLKLSEKRARAVAKYCERIVPAKTPIIINARGEKDKLIESRDRRVEIILYFHPEPKPTKADTIVEPPRKELCYYIDYSLLASSHIRVITKRNKEYVNIEIPQKWFDRLDDYTATDDADGKPVLKKIKWIAKPTNGRTSRYNYQTQIPKADFDKYSVFVPRDTPCRDCNVRFTDKGADRIPDTCFGIDNFLMEYIEFMLPLKRTHVIIRVPKEYVNVNETYYLEHHEGYKLTWETEKGKKNERYYYAHVPIHEAHMTGHYFFNSIRKKMPCCLDTTNFSRWRGDSVIGFICGDDGCNPTRYFYLEAGDHYDKDFHNVYLALGYNRYFRGRLPDRHYISVMAGIDRKPGFYAAARYQYNYLIKPVLKLNPFLAWQRPVLDIPTKDLMLYFGTALETNHTRTGRTRLEQQLHAGIAVVTNYRRNRLFLQYGPAYDYLSKGNPYAVLQVGFDYRIR